MAILDVQIRTIACNGPNCDKTITFDQAQYKETVNATPWLQTMRVIQTSTGAVFAYCSDTCEMENTATGVHNPPETKKIVDISTAGGNNAIALAAEAAKRAIEATKSLKAGAPVTL